MCKLNTNFPSWDGSWRGMADKRAGKEMEESIFVLLWVGLTWHRKDTISGIKYFHSLRGEIGSLNASCFNVGPLCKASSLIYRRKVG